MKSSTWYLQGKAGRRFRLGHPWVFANELKASPKGIEPGSPIELRDERGEFLARGYGNPHSLIAFRTMSRRESEMDPWQPSALAGKIISAAHFRKQIGLGDFSHRMVFGESDFLPGLVMDRFLSEDGNGVWVFKNSHHSDALAGDDGGSSSESQCRHDLADGDL